MTERDERKGETSTVRHYGPAFGAVGMNGYVNRIPMIESQVEMNRLFQTLEVLRSLGIRRIGIGRDGARRAQSPER